MKEREDNIGKKKYRDDSGINLKSSILDEQLDIDVNAGRAFEQGDAPKNTGRPKKNADNKVENPFEGVDDQFYQNMYDDAMLGDNLNINDLMKEKDPNYDPAAEEAKLRGGKKQPEQQAQPEQQPQRVYDSPMDDPVNKKAYADLKRQLNMLDKSLQAYEAAPVNAGEEPRAKVIADLNRFCEIAKSNDLLQTHFEEHFDTAIKADFMNQNGKERLRRFVNEKKQQFAFVPDPPEVEQPNNENQANNNNPNNNPENNNQPNNNGQPQDDATRMLAELEAENQRLKAQIAQIEEEWKKDKEEAQKKAEAAEKRRKKAAEAEEQHKKDVQASSRKYGKGYKKDYKNLPDSIRKRDFNYNSAVLSMGGVVRDKGGVLRQKYISVDPNYAYREEQIKQSELNGYKTHEELPDDFLEKQADEIHDLKYYARSLGKEGKFGKQSPMFKEMVKDLEALDKFMKEIGGRTRLNADEKEVYDILSLKAYNSTKNYQDYKNDQISKRKKIQDPKYPHLDKKIDNIKDSEKVRLQGVNEIEQSLKKLREDMYKKEIKEKTDEMQKKCDDQLEALQAEREKFAGRGTVPGGENKALKEALEKNIAETLFYGNRMQDLQKKGKLGMDASKSLNQTKQSLDKQLDPSYSTLETVKKHPFYKEVLSEALKKAENGQALTNEDIQALKKSYIEKEAAKIKNRKMRQQTLKKPENHRNREQQNPNLGNPAM